MRWDGEGAAFIVLFAVVAGVSVPAAAQKPTKTTHQAPATDAGTSDAGTDVTAQLREQEQRIDALQKQVEAQQRELEQQRAQIQGQKKATTGAPKSAEPSKDEAELQAILAEAKSSESGGSGSAGNGEAAQVEAFEPSFKLYGFADMGLERFWGSSLASASLASRALTFVLGNVNVYFDAQPTPNFRFLTEVRFSLLPEQTRGLTAPSAGAINYTSTTVLDSTSPTAGFSPVSWSGIVLERAHIDYTFRDWFNVRAGLFLTPYGIWHVDHGTPTLISTTFPGFEQAQVFPPQQLGVELYGNIARGAAEYGYRLYVSNGRTPGQLDLTDNKAFGGRFVIRLTRPFRMQFGLSGYVGWYDEDKFEAKLDPSGNAYTVVTPLVRYAEQGFGADVSLDIGDLRIRTEFALRRIIYDGLLRANPLYPGLPPDHLEGGGYFMAAYRLPWWGLEPFVFMDVLSFPTPLGEGILFPSVGLNIHFNPSVVLKFQYTYMLWVDWHEGLPPPLGVRHNHINLLVSRFAIAF